MREKTEIEKYAQAPWVHCPSLRFERLEHFRDSNLLSSINQQIKEHMYSRFYGKEITELWTQFERLVNGILRDLRIIVDDDTCTIVRIGTLNALQPKWLVFRKMYESVKDLGYSECHIFADRIDLLLYYGSQAEAVSKEIIKYIDWLFESDQLVDSKDGEDISIEDRTVESLYSSLFKTYSLEESIESYKTFLTSIDEFSYLLNDCVYAQRYYLTINTQSLYNNVKRFQQNEFGIYTSRHEAFINDYNNALKALGRKGGISNPEENALLQEEAFYITIQKSYPEAYTLYEANRGKLESLNDARNYSDEGWLQTFFSSLFQTRYIDEQRDTEGKLKKVYVNEKGNTSVEGKSGWERWIDFLTVIALIKEHEQKQQPKILNDSQLIETEPTFFNQIFIKNLNGKPIDFALLRKLLYDCFVVNIRFKYDWYAPYRFFLDMHLLNDTGLKSFATQMNTWYKGVVDSHKCDEEALSDWNCGYTGDTHYNLWEREAFQKDRIGKKQTEKGFQRLLTHIIALKEQFKTIPVKTNSDNEGIR